jgi:hypothetical protein
VTVTRKLTAAELGKAARNLKRIEGFLLTRCEWTLDPSDREAFDALKSAVNRLGFTVGQKTLALGIESRVAQSTAPEPEPHGTFDPAMLDQCAEFLRKLDQWFLSQSKAVPEAGAGRFLGEIQHSLESARRALTTIDESQEPIPTATETTPETEAESETEAEEWSPPQPDSEALAAPAEAIPAPPRRQTTSSRDDIYEGTRDEAGKPPAAPPEQLAFQPSETEPMYEWVGPETVDLTELGKQRVEELFQDQGVSFFRYQLENFADEIKKRIENAPEGHVLVVKVRSIGDERKPFLSYVAEAALPKDS